jgi:hypothetical protein
MAADMRDVRGDGERDLSELARGDELGKHHGRRLQGFFFVLGILAGRSVLHHQHADRVARPQDRHAEEGVIDLLARLRQVFEGRMRLGVGQIEDFRVRRDGADEAFPDLELRGVNGLALQSFRRIELQHLAGAHDVERAHLGHHVGRDDAYRLVELSLCRLWSRHDLAQAPKQHSRAKGS